MTNIPDSFEKRAFLLSSMGGLAFLGLGARMTQLQIFGNKEFRLQAADNRFNLVIQPASRGPIYDRFGIPLAVNRRDFRVLAIKSEIGKREDVFKTIDQVGSIVGLSQIEIAKVKENAKTSARFLPTQIASNLSWEKYSRISLYAGNFIGVYPEMGENRNYPLSESFAHVVGYVAKANDKEIQHDPSANHPSIRVGKEGLEKSHEQALKGKHGAKKMEVDAHGRIVREVSDPSLAQIPGEPLVLTVDAELQQIAYDQLKGESGAIIVMDVHNGELLVLASAPAYNPNKFIDGITSADYKSYINDEKRPLYPKAIRGLYPPGSTYKMITALAALENGVTDEEETVNCPGFYQIGNAKFHCHKKHGHGRVNVHNAIKLSCDVFFYEMGRRLGGDKMAQIARQFGFGTAFDINIPGVAKGYVPDSAWKLNKLKTPWAAYDSINMAIGQGMMVASPLQLAVMTARIASGGKMVVPKLIKLEGDKENIPVFGNLNVLAKNITAVQNGMIAVSNEAGGTARSDIGIEGVQIAGKTGTSQVRRISKSERARGVISNSALPWNRRDHGLFVSYAPIDAPKYVCVCVIEHGGGGSKAAAPRAREVLKATLLKDPSKLPIYSPIQKKQSPSRGVK